MFIFFFNGRALFLFSPSPFLMQIYKKNFKYKIYLIIIIINKKILKVLLDFLLH